MLYSATFLFPLPVAHLSRLLRFYSAPSSFIHPYCQVIALTHSLSCDLYAIRRHLAEKTPRHSMVSPRLFTRAAQLGATWRSKREIEEPGLNARDTSELRISECTTRSTVNGITGCSSFSRVVIIGRRQTRCTTEASEGAACVRREKRLVSL